MKNSHAWRRTAYVLATTLIALAGMLLVQHLASADGNSEKMTPVHKNYDWGVTRPGGQGNEHRHRQYLDDTFQVWVHRQDARFYFNIHVPGPLTIPGNLWGTQLVNYSLEDVFLKFVDSREACDEKRSDSTVRLQGLKNSQGNDYVYVDTMASNENQYTCLTVKLKGDINNAPDTHPEWTFVHGPVHWAGGRPQTVVIAEGRRIEAFSQVGNGDFTFDFHYTILDQDEYCDWSAFNVAPNHPSVRHSNLFLIPESPSAQAWYQDRNVCFRASITNFTSGAHMYRYHSFPIPIYQNEGDTRNASTSNGRTSGVADSPTAWQKRLHEVKVCLENPEQTFSLHFGSLKGKHQAHYESMAQYYEEEKGGGWVAHHSIFDQLTAVTTCPEESHRELKFCVSNAEPFSLHFGSLKGKQQANAEAIAQESGGWVARHSIFGSLIAVRSCPHTL